MFGFIFQLVARGQVLVLAGALLILAAGPLRAQAPEAFFAGKTITIVVGFEAGGGYDAYARMLARHMGRHAGGANIVVQNRPGAGSLVAANYLFSVAPRDGTVFGIISSGVLFDPLFGNKAAQFEATEFSWLGSVNREVSTCQIWHTAPITRCSTQNSRSSRAIRARPRSSSPWNAASCRASAAFTGRP
jgi:tripartite-type tricarboxylate transporter receptor subunit TctC